MANGVLGMEFGSSRLKIAEVRDHKLVKFASAEMPDNIIRNGEVVSMDGLSDLIQEVLKKQKFSAKKVCLAVPDAETIIRRLHFPLMTEAQLKVNLPFEFHDFITGEKEDYLFDYAMIGIESDDSGKDTGMDLLGVAVRRQKMLDYQTMFHRSGLKLIKAAPASLAVGCLVNQLVPDSRNRDFAVLDLGYHTSDILMFSDGIYDTKRSYELGCETMAQRLAEQRNCDIHIALLQMQQNTDGILDSEAVADVSGEIAVNVMRAVNYYTYEKRDNSLETLYVAGGGAWIEPLVKQVSDTVGLKVVLLSSLKNDAVSDEEALISGPAASGICFYGERGADR
ncbi:MAG: pilus assembly protein PilM [Bulleidia sp.]